ncbi:MAG: PRC-barrel domain-containing protein [Opitutales bacterium]
MLQNLNELYGSKLAATDGDIGHVKDFYFDDQTWMIRYLIADTGSWLTGRLVLLSPHAFGILDHYDKTLHVKLHKKQIEDSPPIESHRPVSRQYEEQYHRYYGWPDYWESGGLWGMGGCPAVLPPPPQVTPSRPGHQQRDDINLRSIKAVTGYHIEATDGAIGSVCGFLVDDKSWAIRQLLVEAGHWYSGKEIQISPRLVGRISHPESKVFVNLTKADIRRTAVDAVATAVV